MNSKKLWQAFFIIFAYLVFTAVISYAAARLAAVLSLPWGVPLGVGVALWVATLVLYLCREKVRFASFFALFVCMLGSSFLIAAYIVGTNSSISLVALLLTAVFCGACYPLYMLLLTAPLKSRLWFVILSFILWIAGSVLLGVFLSPVLLQGLNLPADFGTFLLFFYLLLGSMAIGSVLPAEDFSDMAATLLAPALCATFFIGVIVVVALACGDSGDCDCSCGDCFGDCGSFDGTSYKKKQNTTMQKLSQ